jgi:hypothetical protein
LTSIPSAWYYFRVDSCLFGVSQANKKGACEMALITCPERKNGCQNPHTVSDTGNCPVCGCNVPTAHRRQAEQEREKQAKAREQAEAQKWKENKRRGIGCRECGRVETKEMFIVTQPAFSAWGSPSGYDALVCSWCHNEIKRKRI